MNVLRASHKWPNIVKYYVFTCQTWKKYLPSVQRAAFCIVTTAMPELPVKPDI